MTKATPTKDHDAEQEDGEEKGRFYDGNDEPHDRSDDDDEDDDDDVEDDDNDEDEDDDDEDDSFWQELTSAWRQHLLAVLIALAAAILGYQHLEGTTDVVRVWHSYTGTSHEHIHRHEKMAGIHFCTRRQVPSADPALSAFEFRVPKDLMSAMEHHYRVDAVKRQDIAKSEGFSGLLDAASHVELIHPEFHCLQQASTPKSFVPGQSFGYETPSIEAITNTSHNKKRGVADDGSSKPKVHAASLTFTGFAAKFINLSPKPILLHWDGPIVEDDSSRLVTEIAPMEAVGTATLPGQSFSVSPVYDSTHALQRWTVTADTALLVYEPVDMDEQPEHKQRLSQELRVKYSLQKLNLKYANDYLVATGRPWLANFPRPPPMHHMWPADYIGQRHAVSVPTIEASDNDESNSDTEQQFDLEVVSVAPRVLTIDNFLTPTECNQVIALAQKRGLHQSTVVGGSRDTASPSQDKATRSSTNTWMERHEDPVLDTLYHRAATVLGIDDSLLQHRSDDHPELPTHHSIAESLQVVHYDKGQEYTPHHDFTYPPIGDRYQATRFATLLLYLNDVPYNGGGETSFPRAIQSTNHDGVLVEPRQGKAVLFYHVLPDGNMDDLSQHGSQPVLEGEKWVANLWIWDPVIG